MSAQCTATMTEPMGPKTGMRGVCRCYLPAGHVFSTDRDEHGMPVNLHRCECSMAWLDDLQVAEARGRRSRQFPDDTPDAGPAPDVDTCGEA